MKGDFRRKAPRTKWSPRRRGAVSGTFRFAARRSLTSLSALGGVRSPAAKNMPLACFLNAASSPIKLTVNYKERRCALCNLVRSVGLEPTRLHIRPSNVRVCRFRHDRSYAIWVSNRIQYAQRGALFKRLRKKTKRCRALHDYSFRHF